MTDTLRIATRQSPLALWQAHHVASLLRAAHPGLEVTLVELSTEGDRFLSASLAAVGGKGLFVKEIEQALFDGRAELAVHSLKDMTSTLPEGLILAAVPEREDPRDALLSPSGRTLEQLPFQARVGTSSQRRSCILRERRPDLRIQGVRGNVQTRLRKLEEEQLDGLVLALAGLRRMGLEDRITQVLSTEVSLPAVGQGVLAVECREDDARTRALLAPIEHRLTREAVIAERAFLARLEGGCTVPMAGHAVIEDGQVWLRGLIGSPDGTQVVRGERRGPVADGARLGNELAEELLGRGGAEILRAHAHATGAQRPGDKGGSVVLAGADTAGAAHADGAPRADEAPRADAAPSAVGSERAVRDSAPGAGVTSGSAGGADSIAATGARADGSSGGSRAESHGAGGSSSGAQRLAGRRVWVTRPRERAEALCFLLEDEGAEVIALPLLELLPPEDERPLRAAAEHLQRYRWILFTSPAAVESLVEHARQEGTLDRLRRAKLGAVGPRTAATLRGHGLQVEVEAETPTGPGLFAALRGDLRPGDEVLLPVAEQARPELYEALLAGGVEVTRVVAYRAEQVAPDAAALAALHRAPPAAIVLASPRSVESLLELPVGRELAAGAKLVAIGPTTAGALEAEQLPVAEVATTPTPEGLLEAVVRAL